MPNETYKPAILVNTAPLLHEERLEYYKLGLGPHDVTTIFLDDSSQQTGYSSVLGIFLDKISRKAKEDLDKMVEERLKEGRKKEPAEPEMFLFGQNRRPLMDCTEEFNLVSGHRRALEYTIAKYLSCRLKMPVYPVPELMQHPQHPFLIAKLDFVAVMMNPDTGEFDHPVNLQCRTDTHWNLDKLKEEIPPAHDIFCRAQMAVSGLDETILIYLCDNNEGATVIYRIPRGKTMEQKLIQSAKQFWASHVETEILPFPRAPSDGAARDIALYAENRLQYHRLPEIWERGMPELARQYAECKAVVDEQEQSLDEAKEALEAVKHKLSGYMLNKPEAVCGDLKMKWREYKSRTLDHEAFALAYPELYNRFVTERVKPGFEIRVKKPKKQAAKSGDAEAA
jgi:predicted phage-related endonuclease